MKHSFFILENNDLKLRISLKGGSIVDASYKNEAILRPYKGREMDYDISKAASFPLVPFANRVENNIFQFRRKTYLLKANSPWDKHFLHGEAWLSEWTLLKVTPTEIEMEYICENSPYSPYCYKSYQKISIENNTISMQLSVKNNGNAALPFGLGHHPFFFQDGATTLQAKAEYYYGEKHDYLPDEKQKIPPALHFENHKTLPRHWLNNGFGGWDGHAEILWPNQKMGARLTADKNFSDYFIFTPDKIFDASYQNDFFCFEPMTHPANAHKSHIEALHVLEPKESFSTVFQIHLFER